MEKLHSRIILKATVICLLGISSYANSLEERGPVSFENYDINKSGFISKSEFYEIKSKRMAIRKNQGMPMKNASNSPEFTFFDTNNDGKLSKIELLEGQNSQMKYIRSNKVNMNNNSMKGMNRNMPTFENYDLNNDGHISYIELEKARKNRIKENKKDGKMARNTGNATPFSIIDANSDGKITKAEFIMNQVNKRNK